MQKSFKVGDHVIWNSEAGHVTGRIVSVHTKDVNYKDIHHASEGAPQYEMPGGLVLLGDMRGLDEIGPFRDIRLQP